MNRLPQKGAARQALLRSAGGNSDLPGPDIPPENTASLADFAHATDTANFLLAYDEFPPELRSFVDAIIGVAGSRTDEFPATDELIAERMGCSTRTVSRHREEFLQWQMEKGVTWIVIQDHYTDREGKRHAHRYRVHLHRLAVEAVEDARVSGEWFKNPGKALNDAARAKRGSAPNMPARKRRGRKRETDARTTISKNLKTAATLLNEAAKLAGAIELSRLVHNGESSFQLNAELIDRVRQNLEALSSNLNAKSEDTGGQSEPANCPPVSLNERSAGQEACRQIVHKELDSQFNDLPDELKTLQAFSSVGVAKFKVLFKDDVKKQVVHHLTEDVDVISARLHMKEYLECNRREHLSLILDMKGNGRHFCQVDEASVGVLQLLSPISFIQIDTSTNNSQAWLALSPETPDSVCEETWTRLFAKLQPSGANRGSNGGLRWPGSLNLKPERRLSDGSFPIVTLRSIQMGRITTPNELERLGLLAPKVEPQQPMRHRLHTRSDIWPDYVQCLRERNGDRSRADWLFSLRARRAGFSVIEISQRLFELSDKAKHRTRKYSDHTAQKATRVVGV
jgi:hypothetical protein